MKKNFLSFFSINIAKGRQIWPELIKYNNAVFALQEVSVLQKAGVPGINLIRLGKSKTALAYTGNLDLVPVPDLCNNVTTKTKF